MNFRIAVVGTGAIGSYYGGKLAYHGRDVHFLVRSGLEEIRRLGIDVRGRKESFRLANIRAYKTTEAIGLCDLVLIALKATNNDVLPELIPPNLFHPCCMRLRRCSRSKMAWVTRSSWHDISAPSG